MQPNRYSARLDRGYRGEGRGPVSTELTPQWPVGRFGQETSRGYHGPNGRRFDRSEIPNRFESRISLESGWSRFC
jgi:hypothetical protein